MEMKTQSIQSMQSRTFNIDTTECSRVLTKTFDPTHRNKMGLGGIVTGSLFGFSTKFGSNLLQKVPVMRESWEYVLLIGAGAFAGNYLEKKYYRDVEEVEEIRHYLEKKSLTDRNTE
ncbi:unnamed protein product [Albugo candida]|uniref:Uncharacterized protein n=1 Tax=Albugo candida TaxID=65357 RepID=A0A024GGH7_9STRA|nr:unnamed protein product [Albugo candida]|eukprot:CCI45864.1 unnamed protein product [Albugo candida]